MIILKRVARIPHRIFLARGLYGAHSEWFLRSLGFTIEDAIAITKAIFVLGADRLTEAYARGHGVADQIEQQYQTAVGAGEVGWSDADRQLVESVRANGLEYVVAAAGGAETFSDIRSTRGFTSEELTSRLDESLALRVPAFLKFFSANFGELPASPDPLALNPLTQTPLLVDGDRFFAFVPPLLWEAVLNGPHFALIRDSGYRAQYDDERAAWLEQQANSAFARLCPKADVGWSVTYGPKATRCELDGIVVYGRKVVLLECKWKTLTVSARQGAADALTRDITQSIKASFDQARRARDYIRASTGDVVFTDPNGAVITVDSRNVNEIVLLSVLGRGALSTIAANPLEIKALGFFGDGELPWALSLFDLLAVCRTMEFGAQFFDYARRRAAVVSDGRFNLHDEWDLVEFYFAGAPPNISGRRGILAWPVRSATSSDGTTMGSDRRTCSCRRTIAQCLGGAQTAGRRLHHRVCEGNRNRLPASPHVVHDQQVPSSRR